MGILYALGITVIIVVVSMLMYALLVTGFDLEGEVAAWAMYIFVVFALVVSYTTDSLPALPGG